MSAVSIALAFEDEELVDVRGILIDPAGSLAYDDGRLQLHLKGLASTGYDDNVNAVPSGSHPEGDAFADAIAGLELRYHTNADERLDADAEYQALRFRSDHALDMEGASIALRHRYDGPRWRERDAFEYARVDDPLIQTGEIITRDEYAGEVGRERLGLTSRMLIQGTILRTRYAQDSGEFQAKDRDVTDYVLRLRYGRNYSAASEYHETLITDLKHYDRDYTYNNSVGSALEVGGSTPLAQRAIAAADLGVGVRRYSRDFAQDAAYDDRTVWGPIGTVALRWPFEEASELHVRAYAALEDSIYSNALYLQGVTAGGRLRLAAKASALLDASEIRLENSGAAAGQVIEIRYLSIVHAGLEYLLRDGVAARASGDWTRSQGNAGTDYTRIISSMTIAAAF